MLKYWIALITYLVTMLCICHAIVTNDNRATHAKVFYNSSLIHSGHTPIKKENYNLSSRYQFINTSTA